MANSHPNLSGGSSRSGGFGSFGMSPSNDFSPDHPVLSSSSGGGGGGPKRPAGKPSARGGGGVTVMPPPSRMFPKPAAKLPGDPKVARVQRQLVQAGYKIAVDGIEGPQTDAAIRHYNASLPARQAAAKADAFVNAARALHFAEHPYLPLAPVQPKPVSLRGATLTTAAKVL